MGIMITGCLSTFLVLQLDEFRPKVGDIVAFKPGSQDSDMWQMTIPATSVSAIGSPLAECSLDPNAMAEQGGSLLSRDCRPTFTAISYSLGRFADSAE